MLQGHEGGLKESKILLNVSERESNDGHAHWGAA